MASVSLLQKTAEYFLFLYDSARFEQTALDDRLIWSVRAYLSSEGKPFVI